MRGAPVHELPQPICELREPRAPGVADDPIPQRPHLHTGHLTRRARAQVLEPAGPGRRVGVDKVLHAILQVLRRLNAQVPRAAAASGLAEDLATEGPEVNAAEARESFMSVCSEVRKRVPPTSMRLGTSSGCRMAMLHLPWPCCIYHAAATYHDSIARLEVELRHAILLHNLSFLQAENLHHLGLAFPHGELLSRSVSASSRKRRAAQAGR